MSESLRIGQAAQWLIGTPDAARSFAFYQQLGFRQIAEGQHPDPWILITDDSIVLMLHQDGLQHLSLTYFDGAMETRVAQYQQQGLEVHSITEHEGRFVHGILTSPEGFNISLVNQDAEGMFQPARPTLKEMPAAQVRQPEFYPNPILGIFGEMALPVEQLETSIDFWRKVGYEVAEINTNPYPWTIAWDGQNVVGLHQSTHFEQPAFTYFAADMAERIQKFTEQGLPNLKPLGGKDDTAPRNAFLLSPEAQLFFLFSI